MAHGKALLQTVSLSDLVNNKIATENEGIYTINISFELRGQVLIINKGERVSFGGNGGNFYLGHTGGDVAGIIVNDSVTIGDNWNFYITQGSSIAFGEDGKFIHENTIPVFMNFIASLSDSCISRISAEKSKVFRGNFHLQVYGNESNVKKNILQVYVKSETDITEKYTPGEHINEESPVRKLLSSILFEEGPGSDYIFGSYLEIDSPSIVTTVHKNCFHCTGGDMSDESSLKNAVAVIIGEVVTGTCEECESVTNGSCFHDPSDDPRGGGDLIPKISSCNSVDCCEKRCLKKNSKKRVYIDPEIFKICDESCCLCNMCH